MFLKEFFEKVDFEKKSADEKLPSIIIADILFDFILYVLSVMLGGSSWVESVLSKDKCVLFKDTTQ